jgi:hypothetical protein
MSVSIRALPKTAVGECSLSTTEGELPFWDSDLAGRICQSCERFLGAAESALIAAKFGHRSDFLVFLVHRRMSKPITIQGLQTLLALQLAPCISLYLPTH